MADETPTQLEAFIAYALSATTTLLWIGCVIPAGPLGTHLHPGSDAATPMYREPVLLVPGLLLLVIVPTGCTLARRFRGMRSVLAGTDAFVATFVGSVLGLSIWKAWHYDGTPIDIPSLVAVVLLFVLGAMSTFEAWRCTREPPRDWAVRWYAGARLALCLLVLVLPLSVVLHANIERASLLAPFLFVALSSAGVALAKDIRGLRRTAAILQLLLAAHVYITLRYTMYRALPAIMGVELPGQVTLALAAGVVALAGLQLLLLLGRGAEGRAPAAAAESR